MNRLLCSLFALALFVAACGDDADAVDAGTDINADLPADADSPAEVETPIEDGAEVDLEPNAEGEEPPPDPDAPIQFGSYPVGELAIELTAADGTTTSYSVSCLGDTATLFGDVDLAPGGLGGTAADRMCTRLADAEVQELLFNGFPADLVCTDQFGSDDVAVITGTLDGNPVDIEIDRVDGCGIDTWDRLLVDVLPAVE